METVGENTTFSVMDSRLGEYHSTVNVSRNQYEAFKSKGLSKFYSYRPNTYR
jgi:hypothetical protein